MRILLAIEAAGGGAGRHVLDLASALEERGHEVVMAYSRARAEDSFITGVRALKRSHVVEVPMHREVGLRDAVALRLMHRLHRLLGPFDVVHGHSSKAGALVRLGAPASCARVYTPHGLATMAETVAVRRRAFSFVERRLGRYSTDALIAVSVEELQHAESIGIPRPLLYKVPNGVPESTPMSRAQAREELGLGLQATVVGFVGRLEHPKDPLRFVDALGLACRALPHLRGVMIGDGADRGRVERRIAELELRDAIQLRRRSDASDLMPAFDMLCISSRSEAMPYVLLEALRCGLPVVTTAVGGVEELVADGWSGPVVPADADASRLAQCVVDVVSSEVCRSRLASQARQISEQYTVCRMVDDTLAVYESAVRRRRSAR